MTSRLVRAALTLALGGAASRVLGLLREVTIAALYGAGRATDAYSVVIRVPSTFYDLLVGGAIHAALVPVFSAESEKDDADFARLLGAVLALVGVIGAAASLLVAFAAPALLRLLTNFKDAETEELATAMLRIVAPSLLLFCLIGVGNAALQSRRKFVFQAFGASIFNVTLALSAWAFLGLGGVALAWAWMAASAAQFAVQVVSVARSGAQIRVALADPRILRVARLYLPVLLGSMASAAAVGYDTLLATGIGEGVPSALRNATTITQFALGVVSTAIGIAVLPELSRAFDPAEFRRALGQALRVVWTIILPLALFLAAVRLNLIGLLFERGAFTPADTARTALAFLAYTPGIPAAALDQILILAFYARQDSIRPVVVGVVAIGVFIALATLLAGPLGMVGLALANSGQWIAHAVIMAVLATRMIGRVAWGAVAATGLRTGVAAGVSAAAVLGAAALVPPDPGALVRALAVAGSLGVGFALYLGLLAAMRAPEAAFLLAVAARITRRPVPS